MIMVGNSRSGGQCLANHLVSAENERVTVHSVEGFASDDLHGAFKEAEADNKSVAVVNDQLIEPGIQIWAKRIILIDEHIQKLKK